MRKSLGKLTWLTVVLPGVLIVAPAPARATWIPTGHSRSVGAFGSATTPDETDSDGGVHSAPDLGPYTKSVGFSARAGTATADGFAFQSSSITPKLIALEISADAFAMAGEEQSASGSASASCVFEFDLPQPTAVKITIQSYVQNDSGGSLTVVRAGQLTPLIEYDASGNPGVLGMLNFPAGKYTLQAYTGAGAFIESSFGSPDGRSGIEATLTVVPEPTSLGLLVAAFVAGLPLAARRVRVRRGPARRLASARGCLAVVGRL